MKKLFSFITAFAIGFTLSVIVNSPTADAAPPGVKSWCNKHHRLAQSVKGSTFHIPSHIAITELEYRATFKFRYWDCIVPGGGRWVNIRHQQGCLVKKSADSGVGFHGITWDMIAKNKNKSLVWMDNSSVGNPGGQGEKKCTNWKFPRITQTWTRYSSRPRWKVTYWEKIDFYPDQEHSLRVKYLNPASDGPWK